MNTLTNSEFDRRHSPSPVVECAHTRKSSRERRRRNCRGRLNFETLEARDLLAADALGFVREEGVRSTWHVSTQNPGGTLADSFDRDFGFDTDDTFFWGDWDDDGDFDMGISRPGNGGLRQWLLSNDAIGDPNAEVIREFGFPSDVPIVGDWDGDGRTDLGVVRSAVHPTFGTPVLQWLLDTNENTTADRIHYFGAPGQHPVVGDWDADGKTDIGVTDTTTPELAWALDSNEDGFTDYIFNFGNSNAIPVVGDWDGDNIDEPGTIETVNGKLKWFLDHHLDGGGWNAEVFYGQPGDVPVVSKNQFSFAEVGLFVTNRFADPYNAYNSCKVLSAAPSGFMETQTNCEHYGWLIDNSFVGFKPEVDDSQTIIGVGTLGAPAALQAIGPSIQGGFSVQAENPNQFTIKLVDEHPAFPISPSGNFSVTTNDGSAIDNRFDLRVGTRRVVEPSRGDDSSILGTAATTLLNGSPSYDYAPTVTFENGKYRMWWCAGIAGDWVMHAEANSADGPWAKAGTSTSHSGSQLDQAFEPSGNANAHDGFHTCDPSVIKVNGTYYLYYTSLPNGDVDGGPVNIGRIGVAVSSDGKNFDRPVVGGNVIPAIVEPARASTTNPNQFYGIGQPAVLHLDGFVYMLYTDTTADIPGTILIRSADPLFQTNVQEFNGNGWSSVTSRRPSGNYSIPGISPNVDWMYVPSIDMFAVATQTKADLFPAPGSTADGYSTVLFLDRDFNRTAELDIRGGWAESSAFVRDPSGHAIEKPNGILPIDLMKTVGADYNPAIANYSPFDFDIAHVGYDLQLPPSLSVSDRSMWESDLGMDFTVRLSHASTEIVEVDLQTRNRTASTGSDYRSTTCELVFQPGDTEEICRVLLIQDRFPEADEQFDLVAVRSTNVIVIDDLAVGTIKNEDHPPQISISDNSIYEGDSDTQEAEFVVELSWPTGPAVTVDYFITPDDGTVTYPGVDYIDKSGQLTFASGETTQLVTVSIIGDTIDEAWNDRYFVHLVNPIHATVADGVGRGIIVDQDPAPSMSIDDVTISPEGDDGISEAVFTVSLGQESANEITVDYQTFDGSAIAGLDYDPRNGQLTFEPGATSQNVTVNVRGDRLSEDDEDFQVRLSNQRNVVMSDSVGIGTIVDDDSNPFISVDDIAIVEGGSDTVIAEFTVILSEPSVRTVQVDFSFADGTATFAEDYIGDENTIVFAPGHTNASIFVQILSDAVEEDNETFEVILKRPMNGMIGDGQGIGTILNRTVDRIGAFHENTFHLDGNKNGIWNTAASGDILRDFAVSSISGQSWPVVGDWDDDGDDDLGLYVDGRFYLDTNQNGEWDDVSGGDTFHDFGINPIRSTARPVVGDWDNDGDVDLGLYNNGRFYLDTTQNGTWDTVSGGDTLHNFGIASIQSTALPIIGDWDGNGSDNVGLYNDGRFYLDTTQNGTWDTVNGGDTLHYFGLKSIHGSALPVVGDWDGDTVDDLGLYNDRRFYLDTTGNGTWDRVGEGDTLYFFNSDSDGIPVVGSWAISAPPRGAFLDANGPRVERVYVNATGWSETMSSHDLPDAGYSIPNGPSQTSALPWGNLDTILIQLSEDISASFDPSHIKLFGVNEPIYDVSSAVFDASSLQVVIPLSTPIGPDKLRLVVEDSIHDEAGNPLDGDWQNQQLIQKSGDGIPGGKFIFDFNVLPGDTNQSGAVGVDDVLGIRLGLGKRTSDLNYSIFADLNGSSVIAVNDLGFIRKNLGRRLPDGAPSNGWVAARPLIPLDVEVISAALDSGNFDPLNGIAQAVNGVRHTLALQSLAKPYSSELLLPPWQSISRAR